MEVPQKKAFKKVCPQCGCEFLGRKTQVYCSVPCRAMHARLSEREKLEREKERKVRETKKKASLNAISWAARQAHMTYGQFVQQMTEEDEARICEEYAAYLKEQKQKEKEKKLTWI